MNKRVAGFLVLVFCVLTVELQAQEDRYEWVIAQWAAIDSVNTTFTPVNTLQFCNGSNFFQNSSGGLVISYSSFDGRWEIWDQDQAVLLYTNGSPCNSFPVSGWGVENGVAPAPSFSTRELGFDSGGIIELIVSGASDSLANGTYTQAASACPPDLQGAFNDSNFDYQIIFDDILGEWQLIVDSFATFSTLATAFGTCDSVPTSGWTNGVSVSYVTSPCDSFSVDFRTQAGDLSCTPYGEGNVLSTAFNETFPVSYSWSDFNTNGNRYDIQSGIYSVTATDGNGCEVNADVFVPTANAPVVIDSNLTYGSSQSIQIGGVGYHNSFNSLGLRINYTVAEVPTAATPITFNDLVSYPFTNITSSTNYDYNGVLISVDTGVYNLHIVHGHFWNKGWADSSLSCDLVIPINMVAPPCNTFDTITVNSCGSYTSPSGKSLNSNGVYLDTIPNAQLCDSVIEINLTVSSADTNTWTGAIDSSWHVPCNWSRTEVPQCCHIAYVPNTTVKPYINDTALANLLLVETDNGARTFINPTGKLLIDDCNSTATVDTGAYTVGSAGPACGIIFYDKGNNLGGWRYLEAMPFDQNGGVGISWGALTTTNVTVPAQPDSAVGDGLTETAAVIAANGAGSYAAQVANDLSYNGFNDWYLPNIGEFNVLLNNLYLNGKGNFSLSNEYWVVYEANTFSAIAIDVGVGSVNSFSKTDTKLVRAIRRF